MTRSLKRVGYLGMILTGVDAGINIQKACTIGNEKVCNKSKYTENGKALGGITGGGAGGFAVSYGTCTLIFSLPTGGTSMFWCALVAGASGGYLGGKWGGELGENKDEELYRVSLQK